MKLSDLCLELAIVTKDETRVVPSDDTEAVFKVDGVEAKLVNCDYTVTCDSRDENEVVSETLTFELSRTLLPSQIEEVYSRFVLFSYKW